MPLDGVWGDREVGGYEFLVLLVGFLFTFFSPGTRLNVWTEDHSSPVSEDDPPPFLMGERGANRTPPYLEVFPSERRNTVPNTV